MAQFMHQNGAQVVRPCQEVCFENDLPLPDERSGMHRNARRPWARQEFAPMRSEIGLERNENGADADKRQPHCGGSEIDAALTFEPEEQRTGR